MTDFTELMELANSQMKQRHWDTLKNLGVTGKAVGKLCFPIWQPPGVMNGEIDNGYFLPGDGAAHLVQPVMQDGLVIDIVAWRSLQPDKWGVVKGNAWALGIDNIDFWNGLPLLMSATPLEFMKAGGEGFCILDWAAPEIGRLKNISEIKTPDPALGRALISAIQSLEHYPKILPMEARHDAAA